MPEIKTKHFCPIPFNHVAIRPNGKTYPCCFYKHDDVPKDFNLNYDGDVFHHPFLEKIREKLRKDEYVEGCSRCYKNEELLGHSMRTEYINSLDLGFSEIPPEKPELTYIDVTFSNVCNNKCRMCNPDLSTSWYSDAKKLGIPFNSGVLHYDFNLDNFDLSKLKFIKLLGGEPLMEQDKIINLLKRCNLKELKVMITTNATLLPNDELLSLLKDCKKVSWTLSIDAYSTLNDFLRKGSNWSVVSENLKWYTSNFKKCISVDSVVNIYNINCLEDLIKFFDKENLFVYHRYVMVDGVSWMNPVNLPTEIKEKLITKLQQSNLKEKNLVIDSLKGDGNIETFLNYDSRLNSIREEHWKDSNPELYSWLKPYMKDAA
jgi:MoaA/NifB/PqqE/SkfB family radical SAM enzyme